MHQDGRRRRRRLHNDDDDDDGNVNGDGNSLMIQIAMNEWPMHSDAVLLTMMKIKSASNIAIGCSKVMPIIRTDRQRGQRA